MLGGPCPPATRSNWFPASVWPSTYRRPATQPQRAGISVKTGCRHIQQSYQPHGVTAHGPRRHQREYTHEQQAERKDKLCTFRVIDRARECVQDDGRNVKRRLYVIGDVNVPSFGRGATISAIIMPMGAGDYAGMRQSKSEYSETSPSKATPCFSPSWGR